MTAPLLIPFWSQGQDLVPTGLPQPPLQKELQQPVRHKVGAQREVAGPLWGHAGSGGGWAMGKRDSPCRWPEGLGGVGLEMGEGGSTKLRNCSGVCVSVWFSTCVYVQPVCDIVRLRKASQAPLHQWNLGL